MAEEYKGFTIPSYPDSADAPTAFIDYTDDVAARLSVYGPAAPDGPSAGQIWFDTSTGEPEMMVWNGAEWEATCSGGGSTATPPTGADPGPFNDATGGTITEVDDGFRKYRVHAFTANGTFTVVTSHRNFEVICHGGGGGSSQNTQGAGFRGGNGVGQEINETLAVGAYPIIVGAGGGGGPQDPWGQGNGGGGGQTTFGTLVTAAGGGGGIAPGDQNHPVGGRVGAPDGPQIQIVWHGHAAYVASGGALQGTYGAAGNQGQSGAVYVRYQIG